MGIHVIAVVVVDGEPCHSEARTCTLHHDSHASTVEFIAGRQTHKKNVRGANVGTYRTKGLAIARVWKCA